MKVRAPFKIVRTNAGSKLLGLFINIRCRPPQTQWTSLGYLHQMAEEVWPFGPAWVRGKIEENQRGYGRKS